MPTDIASLLRNARLGHTLLEAVPGTALEVGRRQGGAVVVGPVGYGGAEVLPCQHRAALAEGLAEGSLVAYLGALGLTSGEGVRVRLLTPPGMDLGTGVLATQDGATRTLIAATTLCPRHAIQAARAAQTVPHPVRHANEGRDDPLRPVLVDLRIGARHDRVLGTTVLSWAHRTHPAVSAQVEDAVRAAAASCVVDELLLELRAG